MKRNNIAKVGAGGVGVLLITLSVIIGSLGSTLKIDGGYRFEKSTSQTTMFSPVYFKLGGIQNGRNI